MSGWLAFAEPDPRWETRGARDVRRVRQALGALARAVHHVGATSVPGLPASPVLDILAEVDSLERLAQVRLRLLVHGFEARESQPQDCRLYAVDDMLTGERLVELRCYAAGHWEAERTPALFALLRVRPDRAWAYHAAKLAFRSAHARNEAAYRAANRAWLDGILDEALAFWRAR